MSIFKSLYEATEDNGIGGVAISDLYYHETARDKLDATLTPVDITIIPAWIYRAIIRNGLDLSVIGNYAELRRILTIDDMVDFCWASNELKFEGVPLGRSHRERFEKISESDQKEFRTSILPYLYNDEVSARMTAKYNETVSAGSLRATNDMNNCESYRFVTNNNGISIIVGENFLTAMQDVECKTRFIREYLKNCYMRLPLHEVSSTPMFLLYLKSL